MKRWEEERRKKLYANKIQAAKPTLSTQPGKGQGRGQSTNVSSSKGFTHSNTSISTKLGSIALAMSEEGTTYNSSGRIPGASSTTSSVHYEKISDLPIFQLLKAFKLQQYAMKLTECGYGEEIYKLALLNEKQRLDLINQLKVLPGHQAKLMSLFNVIDDLYPKKMVAEQLKQFTPINHQSQAKNRRVTSALRSRGAAAANNTKTLLQQYEMLDPSTKHAFNQTFLANLESVKYNLGQLISQHVNPVESKAAINSIFPPAYFGYGKHMDSIKYDDAYNKEIEALLKKYSGGSTHYGGQSQQSHYQVSGGPKSKGQQNTIINPLVSPLDQQPIPTKISSTTRAATQQQNYQMVQQQKDLKHEMKQAMKDIEKINKQMEKHTTRVHTAASNTKQTTKPQVTQQSANRQSTTKEKQQQPVVKSVAQKQQQDIRPESKQSQKSYQHEVFTDDQERSRITDFDKIQQDQDEDIVDESEELMSDSVLQEAIKMINDPQALSLIMKEQYDQAITQVRREDSSNTQGTTAEDASMLNPLQTGDDSKLNVTTKYYQKQQVYMDDEPSERKRPMSPLIDKQERDKIWNIGQSLDSKQVTSALGYLDLKQICYCLAQALMKHIDYAQGFYFLDDLKEYMEANASVYGTGADGNMPLDFSYNLQKDLKIDIEKAKQKKLEKEEASRKEFELLKQKMQKEAALEQEKMSSQQQVQKSKKAEPNYQEIDEEEEVKDEVEESEYIQDYYDEDHIDIGKAQGRPHGGIHDDGPEHALHQHDPLEDDIDFDYSQTHLEDFLKSQGNNTLLRGTNVQSSQLLNTFISSYSKMRSVASFRESQATGAGANQRIAGAATQKVMNPIQEQESETKTKKSESEDEDLGRSGEDIDLKEVEVTSKCSPSKLQKPILSKGEIEEVRKSEQAVKPQQPQIKIDVKTKEGFKDLLRFQMRIFDQNYDFDRDQLVGGESVFMGNPSLEELYYYCKYVIISGRMEKEIPILCLVYIERFLTKTGVLMNHANWKRVTLISLLLASKIWDDDSLENVHFPQVMPDITLKEIASLEQVFLSLIDFDLIIRGAEYAKYYFVLKTFADNFNSTLPMGPLTVEQMSNLQNNTMKAESDLRDKYNVKLSLKKTM